MRVDGAKNSVLKLMAAALLALAGCMTADAKVPSASTPITPAEAQQGAQAQDLGGLAGAQTELLGAGLDEA